RTGPSLTLGMTSPRNRVTDNALMHTLDGGTIVSALREGEAVRDGALAIREHFAGDAVSLRVLELDGTATLRNEALEEADADQRAHAGVRVRSGDGGLARRPPAAAHRRPLVPRAHHVAGHAVRRRDPARPRARSLPPLRGSALHPRRCRRDVERRVEDADRNRLVHLPPARTDALRRERGPRRPALAGRVLSGGQSRRAVHVTRRATSTLLFFRSAP